MTFSILGPLDIRDSSDQPVTIRRRKARHLLALLICHRDHVLGADQLAEWLWGQQPPVSAIANLHSYVSELRRALATTTAAGGLHTTDGGYLLQITVGELDSDRFEELASAGMRALHEGDAVTAADHLGHAARLWRGDLLAGSDLPDGARSRLAGLATRRLEVINGYATAQLALGRYHDTATDLATTTSRFSGHQPPRQLHLPVPLGQSAHAPTRRLLLGSSLSSEAHPSLRARPRHLPAAPDRFVGRERELAALDRAADDAHLITIVGGPGIGKTGLALTWAHRVADRFPDGQLHVELHGHTASGPADPRDVLASLLRALGEPAPVTTTAAESAAALRTALAGRRALLMLDDAISEAQVRPLLPGLGRCVTVVTSRNRLDGLVAQEGAARLHLAHLSAVEARELLKTMGDQAGGPGDLDDTARRCGYLPLAIRIIAATGLDGDPLLATDGERSVRCAFDLSCVRLGEAERRVFHMLGLLPTPGFTAAQVADAMTMGRSDVADALARLHRVSLIDRVDTNRYQLSPMAHRYAADALSRATVSSPTR